MHCLYWLDKDIHNLVAYGGIDALIWLCRSSDNPQLHHLSTTILALLSEKGTLTHGTFSSLS